MHDTPWRLFEPIIRLLVGIGQVVQACRQKALFALVMSGDAGATWLKCMETEKNLKNIYAAAVALILPSAILFS